MKLDFSNPHRDRLASRILDKLISEFCDDYGIEPDDRLVGMYLFAPPGHEKVSEWLVDRGYRAKPYTFGPMPNGEYIAYGIDLDDTCSLVTEIKLRCTL